MATTSPVLLVISLEDVKSAKVQENVYAPVLISQDTYQVRTPFMARMEELSLPIVLGVVEVPPAPHPPHAHARRLHVALVADVVERELTRHQDQEEACPHGWHTIIVRGINVLIAVIILATCITNARHATCHGIKRMFKKTASEFLRRSFFVYGGYIHWCSFINR